MSSKCVRRPELPFSLEGSAQPIRPRPRPILRLSPPHRYAWGIGFYNVGGDNLGVPLEYEMTPAVLRRLGKAQKVRRKIPCCVRGCNAWLCSTSLACDLSNNSSCIWREVCGHTCRPSPRAWMWPRQRSASGTTGLSSKRTPRPIEASRGDGAGRHYCPYLIYNCHKRISNTLKNMIGREGFRGANQNTEYLHDSQWEGCILLSTNQKA